MTSSSIYDNEQYLFELAQSFMRSRVIFTCMELKLFELLLSHRSGLTCSKIATHLDLHYVENESRCLQDVLDALTTMKFLERDQSTGIYRISTLTEKLLLPHQSILSKVDRDFYQKMPQLHETTFNHDSSQSLQTLMLLRIQELVDLKAYTRISIDQLTSHAEVIILWRQDGLLKEKLQQTWNILPSNKKGLLILVLPNEENDEVTLALNLFQNMTGAEKERDNGRDLYTKRTLKQIGFRTVERLHSPDGLALLLAYK